MIASLVRHHPLLGNLPKLMGIGSVTSLLMANVLIFKMLGKGLGSDLPQDVLFLLQLVFLAVASALLFRGAHLRTTGWHLGLPLPVSILWRSHYLVVLFSLLFLLVFQGAVVLIFGQVMGMIDSKLAFPLGTLAVTLVNPALVLVFVAGMTAGYRVDLADLSQTAGWSRYRVMVLMLAAAILMGLSFLPLVVGILPAAWGALAARRGCRRLPPSLTYGNGLEVGGGSGEAGRWESLATAPDIFRPGGSRVSLAVLNQLFKIPYPWIIAFSCLVAIFGILAAGYPLYQPRTFLDVLRLKNDFLIVYVLFSLTGDFVLRLHKVDALPVKRSALLGYLVIPGILVLLVSYGGTRLWIDWRDIPVEQISFQDRYGKYGVSVGPAFNTMVAKGSVHDLETPWGESHPSVARHPLPKHPSPLAGRSPYLTDEKSSPEFVAYQFSRAVQDIYGVGIEPEELAARYLQPNSEGEIAAPRGGFPVAQDYGLRPRSGGPAGALVLGPLVVGFFLVLGGYFRLLWAARSVTWAQSFWWGIMAVLFLLHILQTFNKLPFTGHWGSAVLVFASARELGEMGAAGWLAGYGSAALLVFASWRFAARMFQKVEAPRV